MAVDMRIRNNDGWILKPCFNDNSVEFEIRDKWDTVQEGKGVVLAIDESEADTAVPELLRKKVMQIQASGSKYGFQVVKAPGERIELSDGSFVEVPEGILIIFGKYGLDGGFKFERFLGLIAGTLTTGAGVACSVFLPFGKQIFGGSLLGAGTNMITYAVKTNDQHYTTSQLIKNGAQGLISGGISSAITKVAAPLIKLAGNQIAQAVGSPALMEAAAKAVQLGARIGAQAAANAGIKIVQDMLAGKSTTWEEIRQAAAIGALGGLVGGLVEEAGQLVIKEITKLAEVSTGYFPTEAYKDWIRFLTGASSGAGGAVASGMLQNYYRGTPLFSGLGTSSSIAFLVGGAMTYAQICKDNILKKEMDALQEKIKGLEEKLKKLGESVKKIIDKKASADLECDPIYEELKSAYDAAFQDLMTCLAQLFAFWRFQKFQPEANCSIEDCFKKLANHEPAIFVNDKGCKITVELSYFDDFLIITDAKCVVQWIKIEGKVWISKGNGKGHYSRITGSPCFAKSFKDWLNAYRALPQKQSHNKPLYAPFQKDVTPHPVLERHNDYAIECYLAEKAKLVNRVGEIRGYLDQQDRLNPNVYIAVNGNIPQKDPQEKNFKPKIQQAPQKPRVATAEFDYPTPPAPREYKLIYYPAPIIIPPVPIFPQPTPFVAPIFDARVLRVQQIEMPSVQARRDTPQPVDVIHSVMPQPQLIKNTAKGEHHLERLNEQLTVVPKSNRSKRHSLTVQFDEHAKRLEQIGHSYKYPNGDKYIGEWASGLPHGYGEMRYVNGERYEGDWVTGEADGYGEFEFGNRDFYKGKWSCGKMHGHGTYRFANGDFYIGSFVEDNENGKGTCHYSNGDKYDGEWKAGRWHGQGKFTSYNGQIRESLWQKGREVNP